jgi:riboflavin synthase
MSDTPETDKNTWSDSSEGVLHNVVTADFARKLERERDEARAERDILRLDAQRETEHHDRLVKELENLYDKLKSQRS